MTDKLYFGAAKARRVNSQPNTFMLQKTLKKLCSLLAVGVALVAATDRADAQIRVGLAGSTNEPFTTVPPVANWSTRSIPGASADFNSTPPGAGITALDAAVQTNTAALINAAVPSVAVDPPATAATAQHSTSGYLQTRPTGNAATLLMAKLTNTSGLNLSNLTIRYTLTVPVPAAAEESPGQRVYYSLSGLANSWVALGNFGTAGTQNLAISFSTAWTNGRAMYLLFADDNSVTNADGVYQIDNFSASLPFPGITTQPQDSSVSPGQSVALTVVATGDQPLFYQWRKGGSPISGATNATYTIVNAQAPDNGTYSVVVSNAFGTVTSSNAVVTVNCSAPAGFASSLLDQTLSAGQTLTLTVAPTGTFPISYQWSKNGVSIAGATNATYTKLNAQIADSGLYSVVIDNCAQLPSSDDAVVIIPTAGYVLAGLTNQAWRYNQTDGDLGTAWRGTNYNDTSWPLSNALLAVENLAAINPLIRTVLQLAPGGTQIPTYYFRSQFVLSNDPALISLVASNYFDDGAVVYVNGTEAFRYNMPAGNIAWATLASAANPAGEGTFIVSNIPSSLLIQGTNTIAVEVHQSALNSSDVAFGTALHVNFLTPSLLVITNQPQSLAVEETKTATFTLGLQGQPAFYQWFKNGSPLGGATRNPLSITGVITNDTGSYFVVASNSVNVVTSSVVTLTVLTDTNRPILVAADGTVSNNLVTVSFSESVLQSTATNIANYKITNTLGGTLTISSAVLQNGTNVLLTTTAPRVVNNNYILIVSGVRDISPATNMIVTNSMLPIRALVTVISMNDGSWRWYDPYPPFQPDDIGSSWRDLGFDDSLWPLGEGIFWNGDQEDVPGVAGTPLSQTEPVISYFRRGFNLQASPGAVEFLLTRVIDDGAVFYLNSQEFFRTNLPAGVIDYLTPANNTVGNPARVGPFPISLPSYKQGDNVLAVELHQNQIVDVDKFFGAQLDAKVDSFAVGPVVITSGPSDRTVTEGQSVTFDVTQVGGTRYQWQSNSVAIPGATNSTYTIPFVTTNMHGSLFRVAVSNATVGVVSTNATLRLLIDSNAPTIVSAFIQSANTVLITFSDVMAAGPASITGNYYVTNSVGGVAAVSSAMLTNGSNVLLTFGTTLNGTYTIVVNNLTDATSRANPIAPNSAVTVGLSYSLPFTTTGWKYLLINTNEEIQTSFMAPSFDDSTWRGPSNGLFYVEDAALPLAKTTPLSMFADPPTNAERINTHYFRHYFVAPVGVSNFTMRLRHVIDDGVILHLNGQEVFRFGMAAGAVTAASQANVNVGDAALVGPVDVVVNLLPGTNVFAAEVHQNGATSSDVVFGLELSGTVPSIVVPAPAPVQIVEQPRSRTNVVTSTAFFRSTATGTGPLYYQWYKGAASLAGQTNSLLVLPNVQSTDATNYYARVTNSFSSANSTNALLTVTNGGGCIPSTWATPKLFVADSAANVVLRWTNSTDNCGNTVTFVLQQSLAISNLPAAWVNVSGGTASPYSTPHTNFSRFFRLIKSP